MRDVTPRVRRWSRSRRARPTLESLEDRRLLTNDSVNLNGIYGISTYTNVPFNRNLVAELTGLKNGQPDLNAGDFTARIDWGDGGQSNGELTLDGTGNVLLVKGSHKYATANNNYHITVHATGPGGSTADRETAEARVEDLPAGLSRTVGDPGLNASGDPLDVTVNLNGIYGVFSYTNVGFDRNLVAELSGRKDGQPDLNLSDYQARINWGDGGQWSPAELALDGTGNVILVKGSHVYTKPRTDYHIVVIAAGPDGTTTIRETAEARVEDLPAGLSRTVSPPQSHVSGDPRDVTVNLNGIYGVSGLADRPLDASNHLVAELSGVKDGQPDLTPGDYHAQINWGDDGQWSPAVLSLAPSGTVLLVKGSHVYRDPRLNYHIVVHASGPDGTTTSRETAEANIGPEPPCKFTLKPIVALLTGTAGIALKGVLATFVLPDPGDSAGLTTQINWGDGSITDSTPTPVPAAVKAGAVGPVFGPLQSSGSTDEVPLNHDYKNPGTYKIDVKVEDADGCSGQVVLQARIEKRSKPPVLPDIVATSLTWDAKRGGANFSYRIDAAPLPRKTTVELEWVRVSRGKPQILRSQFFSVTTGTAVKSYPPIHASASALGTPPPGATDLRLMADPANLITESNEKNNSRLLSISSSPGYHPPPKSKNVRLKGTISTKPDPSNPCGIPTYVRLSNERYPKSIQAALKKNGSIIQPLGWKYNDPRSLLTPYANYDEYRITIPRKVLLAQKDPLLRDPAKFLATWPSNMNNVARGEGKKHVTAINRFSIPKRKPKIGDVIHITIPLGIPLVPLNEPGGADVALTRLTKTYFTFSTVTTPGKAGTHPVSGSREWGYVTNPDGSVTYYTRGLDSPRDLGSQLFGTSRQKEGWSGLIQGIGERYGYSATAAKGMVHDFQRVLKKDLPCHKTLKFVGPRAVGPMSAAPADLAPAAVHSGSFSYRVVYLTFNGDDFIRHELAGTTDSAGHLAFSLPPDQLYTLYVYDPSTRLYGEVSGSTGAAGDGTLPPIYDWLPAGPDADHDGIPDIGDFILKGGSYSLPRVLNAAVLAAANDASPAGFA